MFIVGYLKIVIMKNYIVMLVALFMCLSSCSDNNEIKEVGNGEPLELTPNNYRFESKGGSLEIKTEGIDFKYWEVDVIRTIVGGVEKVYYPNKDFTGLNNGTMDINIDGWFTMKNTGSGNNFMVEVTNNDEGVERTIRVSLFAFNSFSGFTIYQDK